VGIVDKIMSKSASTWIKFYGIYLIVAGFAGWLSNPEKAQTALISGGTFGALSVLLGFIAASGRRWAYGVMVFLAAMLGTVFTIRSFISWRAYLAGDEGKLFAACLITSMLVATLVLLPKVVRALRVRSQG